ncbi:protein EARLY FLOWERING 3-like [Camellia sinensis]|uniref:Uncharacterized protein n=1 Tax=Camellia sinensis var. sinensis TaxID=542762 RepID=A0A4S4DYN6_CAMSN|nr:protein EARLY FLOWERING 3-like [Camellia sinensis]XP_028082241.1 protein EARLY FLOWERING 3-like [Camellia sinensis]THG08572.1 hypothetical protein TEA_024456 [Camellia sinensis var. sinensis]
MMKSGKDEEKLMGPLFPRLHINDAEKGGPKAPPRNKMALYEQLGIPSQRFTSGSASMVPLRPNNSGSMIASTSSSHGGGQKRSLCSPVSNSPAFHLAEKFHSYYSGGMNLNTPSMNLESQPVKPTEYHTLNAAGHISMTANFSFYQPHSISKNFSTKKLGDEDDFKIPTFAQSGRTINTGNGQQNMNKENPTASSPNGQLQNACIKQLKQASSSADLISKQHIRNQTEENSKMSPSYHDSAKNPASNLMKGDKVLADTSSSPLGRISESVKGIELHECSASQEKKALSDGIAAELNKVVRRKNDFTVESISCSRPPRGDNHISPSRLENVGKCHEDQCGALQVEKVDRNGNISDNSIVDSISGVDISPDDVVGVIGEKQFWKARRAIVHQQRVFAVQVFELHRLIKVQRLFAASPDLLLGSELFMEKPSIEVLSMKKLPFANAIKAPSLIADPLRPNPNTECAAENVLGKPPLPSLNGDTKKVLNTGQSNYKPATDDAKPPPWCLHPPPGNQWLVPVLSPSEGLVYKPYGGSCPPTSGFVAPVYGSCGPTNLTPVGRDFLNTPYNIPPSHDQGIGILSGTPLGQTYFFPYGMPFMNPSISSSAVEQVSPFARARSNGLENHLTGDINFTIPYQNSCNVSSQKSEANSYCVKNLQASKESEVQGSTASSPSERRVHGDGLPLFPTIPTVKALDRPARAHSTEEQTRVIRVVPHNPRSASESAARIFRSIQEERRRYD